MPMQTLVAGEEITSIGTWSQPIPPSMQSGTRLRLTIIATVPRIERATTAPIAWTKTIHKTSHVSALELPHFLISRVCVQRTAIRRGYDQLEQVRAPVAVYIFQTIA